MDDAGSDVKENEVGNNTIDNQGVKFLLYFRKISKMFYIQFRNLKNKYELFVKTELLIKRKLKFFCVNNTI